MFKHYNEGFSLVELLVVVALIAVLVVVTGSQLQAYNLQGVNATASADLRNAAAAEKMFFANWGVYASSMPFGFSGTGAVITSNTPTPQVTIGQGWINGTAPSASTTLTLSVSNNVGVVINTSAMGASYTMGSKNAAGDRCFAMDSDTREVYWINGPIGAPMASTAVPAALASSYSDIDGRGGVVPCLGTAPASVVWTAL
ncbi:MAG: prepilin-type N-terminal cleavage/methylation domain-containing protein [Nitrospirota bacterium]